MDWITTLSELRAAGIPAVLVTVAAIKGSVPRDTGAKMVVTGDRFTGTIGGGRLEQLILDDARKLLAERNTAAEVRKYPLAASAGQCCGGSVEVLLEPLNMNPLLYLYGAGHVGQALCRTLEGTPFQVHLIDPRGEWVGSESVPSSVIRHESEWEDFNDDALWDEQRVYVAVMTHRHDTDEVIIEDVLGRATRYVGLIGSRNKWERFQERLGDRGTSRADLDRVHCPIGIDLGGGKEPATVAVSIAAQLLQKHFADPA